MSSSSLLPKGLTNPYNNCYLNSVLQSLSVLEPFTSFLDSLIVRNAGPNCVLKLIQNLVNEFQNPNNGQRILSATGILTNMLAKFPGHLQKGRHEDASEFLDCVFDALDADLVEKDIIRRDNGLRFCEKIGSIFNGKMNCFVSCLDANCGYKSNSVEDFVTVRLSFKDKNGQVFQSQNFRTIEDGFSNYCAPEIIEEEEHFFCNGCNKVMRNGVKSFQILEAPQVLSVCLKRFQSSKSGIISKIHDPIFYICNSRSS
jgi:ubiquitin C-terminal hydrolase